jgi:hypothetical protein
MAVGLAQDKKRKKNAHAAEEHIPPLLKVPHSIEAQLRMLCCPYPRVFYRLERSDVMFDSNSYTGL